MTKLLAPTLAPLPSTLIIPSTTRALIRSLSRLSPQSLIALVLAWLEPSNLSSVAPPYLASNRAVVEAVEEDYRWDVADDVEGLREIWRGIGREVEDGGGAAGPVKLRKRDVIDRILEGDWRRGVSLRQLAMCDMMVLEDNERAVRWTALRLVEHRFLRGKEVEEEEEGEGDGEETTRKRRKTAAAKNLFPTVRAGTFISALQKEIAPLVKAHYHLHRLTTSGDNHLTIIRLFVSDTPYSTAVSRSTSATFTDASRTVLIAFPDSAPFVYISVSGTQVPDSTSSKRPTVPGADVSALKRIVLEAIPKALSRPQARAALQSTNLSARSLGAMLALRGNGRGNAANGAYGVFAAGDVEEGPLAPSRDGLRKKGDEVDEEDGLKGLKRSRRRSGRGSPLSSRDPNTAAFRDEDVDLAEETEDEKAKKKRKIDARKRFGITAPLLPASSSTPTTTTTNEPSTNPQIPQYEGNAPLDRFQIRLEESLHLHPDNAQPSSPLFLPSSSSSAAEPAPAETTASMKLTFQGTHVFAGLRKLAELGIVDAARMPSWMTGEMGVSFGVVRKGEMVGGGEAGGF